MKSIELAPDLELTPEAARLLVERVVYAENGDPHPLMELLGVLNSQAENHNFTDLCDALSWLMQACFDRSDPHDEALRAYVKAYTKKHILRLADRPQASAEEGEEEGEEERDLPDDKATRAARIGYAAICRNLIEPLKAFLDHPYTDEKFAHQISDLMGDVYTEDYIGNRTTSGQFAADNLRLLADGYTDSVEPDWLQPLAFFLARAFEDDATPVAFHNDIIDKIDCYTADQLPEYAGDTVRHKLVEALLHNMASEAIAARKR